MNILFILRSFDTECNKNRVNFIVCVHTLLQLVVAAVNFNSYLCTSAAKYVYLRICLLTAKYDHSVSSGQLSPLQSNNSLLHVRLL